MSRRPQYVPESISSGNAQRWPTNGLLDDRSRGLTVWLTGLSGAGKSTIARAVHAELLTRRLRAEVLDADDIRKHLNRDLGFSKEDRDENVRRIGFVADLLTRHGVVVLVAAIAPYQAARDEVRRTIGCFIEVYVDAPIDVCAARDPKGLYSMAQHGKLHKLTGVDDPYEAPRSPEIRCDTSRESVKESRLKVLDAILNHLSRRTGAWGHKGLE